jgi:hypothetical protein
MIKRNILMKKVTTIDRFALVGSLMAGHILNAFYSVTILKNCWMLK